MGVSPMLFGYTHLMIICVPNPYSESEDPYDETTYINRGVDAYCADRCRMR